MRQRTLTYALSALGCVDLSASLWLIRNNLGDEGNPVMARLLGYGIGAFIAAKIGSLAASLGFLEWASQRRPKFVIRASYFAFVAYAAVLFFAFGCSVLEIRLKTRPKYTATTLSPLQMLQVRKTMELSANYSVRAGAQ